MQTSNERRDVMERIVLIGAGGHAKTIIDTIERLGQYEIAGFVDLDDVGKELYRGYRVIGHDDDLDGVYQSGICNAFIAIGFIGKSNTRRRLYEYLKAAGFSIPVIIDPTAIVAGDAEIGEGTYIGRRAVINADARIGKNCIINTGAIIEHECRVGDFSHIAVGTVLCGQAEVGENTFVGANATVLQGIGIGSNSTVGAGAVVIKEVPNESIAIGVPAQIGVKKQLS